MEYADGKVKDLQIAYIGGGSRGWAWTFMTDLAMDEELSGTIRLYDIDAEAAKHTFCKRGCGGQMDLYCF
mgnify:CR=1 FL=1